ncbi:MAG: hypothetical protein MJE77_07595 [Proteobacteria bacterium]|nr:hypothetical protein [Pseudomonadota bacterium]
MALPALATPGQKLAQARQAFELGKYDQAVPLLNYLLYPNAQLSSRDDLIEAHLLLGLAHLELGNAGDAGREIEEALYLDSTLTLDPLVFSEKAIAFVEQRKKEVLERARRDTEARAEAVARERLRQLLENTIVLERRPYYINFIPFGAGQFQNGQSGKGIAFFVSEMVTGGVSLGLFAWQVSKYGYNGTVPDDEAGTVRRVQQAQIVAGGLCLAIMAWGILDSLRNYQSTTRVPADESLLPDDLKPDKLKPKKRQRDRDNLTSSFRIAPSIGPTSGGLVMTLEF